MKASYNSRKKIWTRANRAKYNKPAPGKYPCPMCEGHYKALMRHVRQRHGMMAAEFKEEYGYMRNRSFIQPEEVEQKRETLEENPHIIKENLLKAGQKSRFKPGDPRAGDYERRPEHIKLLRKNWKENVQKT